MDGGRVSGATYALLGMASVAYFLFTFSWFSLAAYLVPLIEDLGLSGTEAGLVTGAVQLSYIPLALASGLAIDRLGSRRAVGAGLLVIGVSHVLRGVATGFASVLLPTLLLGVGGTAITFGLPKLVSELFPPDRVGRPSSMYVVGSTLGSATAFAIARPLVDPLLGGWRPFFQLTGVLVVGYAVCWFLVSRALWGRAEQFGSADGQDFSFASMRADLASVLTHYGLLLLVVVGTMRLFVHHGLSNWLATILETRGMAPTLAGTVTSAFILVRILGILAIPALSDRIGSRRWPIVACGVAGTVGMIGLMVGSSTVTLGVSLVLVGAFTIGGLAPLVRAIPIEMRGIGPALTAVATGLIFTVGEVGGFLGPFSIGVVYDLTDTFAPALVVLAAACFVTAVAGYYLPETAGSAAARTETASE